MRIKLLVSITAVRTIWWCGAFNPTSTRRPLNWTTDTGCREPDGVCDSSFKNLQCAFDSGDCISVDLEDYPDCLPKLIDIHGLSTHKSWWAETEEVGNGVCDGGPFNIEACDFEFGECIEFNVEYPLCNEYNAAYFLNNGDCEEKYNTVECKFDGGDCMNTTSSSTNTNTFGFIASTILVTMSGIIYFLRLFNQLRHDRGDNDNGRPEQQTPHEQTAKDKQIEEDRRKFVLSRIIHKKVRSRSAVGSTENDTDEHVGDANALILPHRIFYIDHPQDIYRHEELGRNGLLSKRLHVNIIKGGKNHPHSPRTSCPICMEDYKDEDDITWSFNEDCSHAFHRECIVLWLMNHDDCPMCRSRYLSDPDNAV